MGWGAGAGRTLWALGWLAVAVVEGKTPEEECAEEAAAVKTPLVLLAVLPPLLNVATAGLLGLLWWRVRAIRTANDEVFQSTMLLTRTALRVTIPRRAVEAIQKVIGDPKQALTARLSKEHLQKIKKTN